jgi:TPR repeat protein
MFNINLRQPILYYLAGASMLLVAAATGWWYFAPGGTERQTQCDLLYRQLGETGNSAQTVAPEQLVAACEAAAGKFPEAARYAYLYGKALIVLNRYPHAIERFTHAARADYAPAQYELGMVNLYGRGVGYKP